MSCNPLPLPQRKSITAAASPTRAECGWFISWGSLEIPKTGQPLQAGGALWASLQAAAQWAEVSLGLFPRRKKALKSDVTTVETRPSLHVASARLCSLWSNEHLNFLLILQPLSWRTQRWAVSRLKIRWFLNQIGDSKTNQKVTRQDREKEGKKLLAPCANTATSR